MKYSLLLLFSLLSSIIWAQDDYTSQIIESWKPYKMAVLAQDYRKVASMTNPMVVEKSGGESYIVDDLLQDQGMFQSQGIIIKDLQPKQPSAVLKTSVEWQAMLPYERTLKIKDEEVIEKYFMFITSQDEGQTWKFFDLSKQDEESIKVYLPHYDDRLSVYLK